MATFFKSVSSIFYGVMIAAVVVVAGGLMATMVPIPGNFEIKIVKSGSMEPMIMTGSLVVIKPSHSYELGNIVTFGKDTKRDIPTTHRIVEIKEENGTKLFVTKGDANEENDQALVQQKDIIGKVLLDIPRAGFILDFARTRAGFIAMIAVPALMVIIDEVFTIVDELAKYRRRKQGTSVGVSDAPFAPMPLRQHPIERASTVSMDGIVLLQRRTPRSVGRLMSDASISGIRQATNPYQIVLR
jgi:signal peptidase I